MHKALKENNKTRAPLYVVDKETNQESILNVPKKKIKLGKVLLFLAGAYLLFLFLIGGYEILQLRNEIKKVKLDQNMLMQQQNELKKEIETLYDYEVIEKLARENLGMVIKGETIMIPAIPGRNLPRPKKVDSAEILD